MKIIEIRYTSKFLKRLRKIRKELTDKVDEHEAIFRRDCFDPRLRTHKLHGPMGGCYSFSITHKYRIVFIITQKNIAEFIDIGDHSIYQ